MNLQTSRPEIGVYLDTNVLLDLIDGFQPNWRPPAAPTKSDLQRNQLHGSRA